MTHRRLRLGPLGALLAVCAGCAGPAAAPTELRSSATGSPVPYAKTLIEGVPHVSQKPDFCGEAAVEMYTAALGRRFEQDQVFELSGLDPSRGMGVTTRELKSALERIGFDPGPTWYRVAASEPAEVERQFAALHADLVRGVPSIVCMHFDDRPDTTEHFRLVLGYDPADDSVVYNDPGIANGAYLRMARSRFLSLWPLHYDASQWTVIRLPLQVKDLQSPPPVAEGHRPAELAQHVMALRKRLPADFTVLVEPPFVVAGDGAPDEVKGFAERTVRWAVARLKRDFFTRDPTDILDIYLFADKASYERHCEEWFGGPPSTPYGFYSSARKALVMNIATGGGTLVHEIVHPFVEANFPDCPAWFNEGLGSLYEQSSSHADHIVGLTNWRLSGLQQALRDGRVPSFEALTATTDHEFYAADRGTNYAQARYLLYYLQEQGLLIDYYRRFLANREADPTGYQTLKEILGEPDMSTFEQSWARFVLGLQFR